MTRLRRAASLLGLLLIAGCPGGDRGPAVPAARPLDEPQWRVDAAPPPGSGPYAVERAATLIVRCVVTGPPETRGRPRVPLSPVEALKGGLPAPPSDEGRPWWGVELEGPPPAPGTELVAMFADGPQRLALVPATPPTVARLRRYGAFFSEANDPEAHYDALLAPAAGGLDEPATFGLGHLPSPKAVPALVRLICADDPRRAAWVTQLDRLIGLWIDALDDVHGVALRPAIEALGALPALTGARAALARAARTHVDPEVRRLLESASRRVPLATVPALFVGPPPPGSSEPEPPFHHAWRATLIARGRAGQRTSEGLVIELFDPLKGRLPRHPAAPDAPCWLRLELAPGHPLSDALLAGSAAHVLLGGNRRIGWRLLAVRPGEPPADLRRYTRAVRASRASDPATAEAELARLLAPAAGGLDTPLRSALLHAPHPAAVPALRALTRAAGPPPGLDCGAWIRLGVHQRARRKLLDHIDLLMRVAVSRLETLGWPPERHPTASRLAAFVAAYDGPGNRRAALAELARTHADPAVRKLIEAALAR